ncbi:MAG TPA: flagellar hook-basal body complex protein FliE [Planctomycetes bacterium]|nr:flagellar hook-basal body complex protein FliE [Planctomycetota bacterium]HIJ70254.1 flagellar hook-basal body complex protein FliE [Planctomycetota bacterium]
MAVNFNPQINSLLPSIDGLKGTKATGKSGEAQFGKALSKGLHEVNDLHNKADASITELLTGKSNDINSVVSTVAKADMSFKLLVAVRDKLVSAYKETMKMQI